MRLFLAQSLSLTFDVLLDDVVSLCVLVRSDALILVFYCLYHLTLSHHMVFS